MSDETLRRPRDDDGARAAEDQPDATVDSLADSGETLGSGGDVGSLYRLLVQNVRDYAIFALDPQGYVVSWNEGAQRIKGYAPGEIIGRHFSAFYTEDAISIGFPQYELEEAAREGRFEDEGWRVRKDGSRFWANVIITALRDRKGRLVGFAKVTRDLTERRTRQEQAIADARRAAEAEAANRTKAEFLAAMSHELRTPLNAIGGYTELLAMGLRGPVTEEQRADLERIRRSQQHLLGIINDILNFSRIEAGQVAYDIGSVSLSEIRDAVSPMIEPQARAKGIHFDAGRCPATLVALGDRAKIQQILLNLLSNAVKFTPAGGRVWLACDVVGDCVALRVSDTGRGVPEDKLQAIFDPFVQLERSLTSGHEGTGLGLAISRDLARAMRGEVTVESRPGEGSAFTLLLPRP